MAKAETKAESEVATKAEPQPELINAEKPQTDYDKKPFVGYFRVLRGMHCEGPGKGTIYYGERWGKLKEGPVPPGQATKERLMGQVVHSKSDLLKLNPADPGMTRKFARVDGPDPSPNVNMAGEPTTV